MKTNLRSVGRVPAIGLALALGVGLFALVVAGLPRAAAAAGLAEPAVSYPCSEAGLNSALAAGGSATFTCAVPTTVIVSARKTVAHSGTLDGGNKLILSGNNVTGVFTVAAGVHLSLLNLTLRDAKANTGAGVYNNGTLNVTHVAFISNTAVSGAALYNAPGALANLSNSSVTSSSVGSGLWNGDTGGATLVVAGTSFNRNFGGTGAAIHNENGPVTVTASSFTGNFSALGGAIDNNSLLWVDSSQFVANQAGVFIADSLSPAGTQPGGFLAPAGVPSGGGAIYMTSSADTVVHSSSFTNNVGVAAGGAIFFGLLPPTKVLNDGHQLTIDGSLFYANCTAGLGGAVAASKAVAVSNSTFLSNLADIGNLPCRFAQTNAPAGPAAPLVPQITEPNGAGGAILSSFSLTVTTSAFVSNTATITIGEGGGAIENFSGGALSIAASSFSRNLSRAGGGAIMNDPATLTHIVGSDFSQNVASGANGGGGAIGNYGALYIDYSYFTGNGESRSSNFGGGAIDSQQPLALAGAQPSPSAPQGLGLANFLSIDHSTFTTNESGNEGGALNAGPAVVANSTFLGNTAPDGGAISEQGPFTMTADAFIGNAAASMLLVTAQQGGAVDANFWGTTILNSTFYNNRAEDSATGGAINVDYPPVSAGNAPSIVFSSALISYSTFLSNTADTNGNGGAIAEASFGLAALTNVLLAHNHGGDCNVGVVFNGENLEYVDSSCGEASRTGDPKALAPANNGGPTLTSALLLGSDAIDHGDNSGCPATDQRGAHRPVGAQCDIGAFEFGSVLPQLWLPLVRK